MKTVAFLALSSVFGGASEASARPDSLNVTLYKSENCSSSQGVIMTLLRNQCTNFPPGFRSIKPDVHGHSFLDEILLWDVHDCVGGEQEYSDRILMWAECRPVGLWSTSRVGRSLAWSPYDHILPPSHEIRNVNNVSPKVRTAGPPEINVAVSSQKGCSSVIAEHTLADGACMPIPDGFQSYVVNMERSGHMTGMVYAYANGDCTKQEGGGGIAGWPIFRDGCVNDFQAPPTWTGMSIMYKASG